MTFRISRPGVAGFALFAPFALAAVHCGGSVPPPTDELSAAQTDIGRAEAGGAPSNPEAKLHLQLATEDLQKAKSQVDQDNKRAGSLVALSRVEAQLALSLAKAASAQAVAQQAQQDVQKAKGGN
jgi:hypothetical protein